MEIVDLKKLDTAILYLQRIADGNNPVNNMPAEDDAVLNNPNVIRCMYFVKEVLEEVKRNGGAIGGKYQKSNKAKFPLEAVQNFTYREDKPITKFVEQLNGQVDEKIYQKLPYKSISKWLKLNGFLEEKYSEEYGKNVTYPTEKGMQIGIRSEKRNSLRGIEYISVIYGKNAQEYIIQNLAAILAEEDSELNE